MIEPAAQAVPTGAPAGGGRGKIGGGGLEGIGEIALREEVERGIEIEAGKFVKRGGDASVGRDQFAEKPVEVIDEGVLVGEESVELDAVQFDGALEAAHEGLRARGEFLEAVDEGLKREVQAVAVGLGCGELGGELVEQFEQVAERGGLEFAGAVQVLEKRADGMLGGLALGAELIEVARAVKLLDRGDIGGVARGGEVFPGDELFERGGEFGLGRDGNDGVGARGGKRRR